MLKAAKAAISPVVISQASSTKNRKTKELERDKAKLHRKNKILEHKKSKWKYEKFKMQQSKSKDKSQSKSKINGSHIEESMRTKAIRFIQNNMSSNYRNTETCDDKLISLANLNKVREHSQETKQYVYTDSSFCTDGAN